MSAPVEPDDVPRRRGRPRSTEVDERVFAATLELLNTDGFQGMSMDKVAAAAGVSKPTLYRRWPSKADLAAAAIAHTHRTWPTPDPVAKVALVAELRDVRETYLHWNNMAMVGTLLAEEDRHPELLEAWRTRIARPRRRRIRQILQQGVADGSVRADTDLDVATHLLVGAFYAKYTVGDHFDPEWASDVVEMVWAGIAHPSGSS
ncbi:TetR/AcrR family transcriptional regulator [Pseudonocardia spinosispora]|uniref:TetR/AcrR family transcriptional regulator n=1 Tax=Pseudonocardia spinosispora TaxID=103441 RepID=UPI00040239EE|nr:TetR/AcrR family transcriptional regulator [Pseudonocardia spinosispora]